MGAVRKTTQQIIDAYEATGSVWRAGKLIGASGQSVHERLTGINYKFASRDWTPEEETELATLLAAGLTLGEAGKRLGRPYAGIAAKASRLGLATLRRGRTVKVPKYDKATTLWHMANVEAYDGRVTGYARENGLDVEMLVQHVEKHCPDRWRAYVESRSTLPPRDCAYCGISFTPFSGKQRFHSRKCSNDARTDANYFGGNYRGTRGLAERTCQMCGKDGLLKLHSHHVRGKKHDPDGLELIAMCPGCHLVVEQLATRTFIETAQVWENLITLVMLRKHGGFKRGHNAIEVHVDIDSYHDELIADEEARFKRKMRRVAQPPDQLALAA